MGASSTTDMPRLGNTGCKWESFSARPHPMENRRAVQPGRLGAMRTRLAALAALVAMSAFITLASPWDRLHSSKAAPGPDRGTIGTSLGLEPVIAKTANASVDDLASRLPADGISPRDLAALLGISGFDLRIAANALEMIREGRETFRFILSAASSSGAIRFSCTRRSAACPRAERWPWA
jgi:hypothetical protein